MVPNHWDTHLVCLVWDGMVKELSLTISFETGITEFFRISKQLKRKEKKSFKKTKTFNSFKYTNEESINKKRVDLLCCCFYFSTSSKWRPFLCFLSCICSLCIIWCCFFELSWNLKGRKSSSLLYLFSSSNTFYFTFCVLLTAYLWVQWLLLTTYALLPRNYMKIIWHRFNRFNQTLIISIFQVFFFLVCYFLQFKHYLAYGDLNSCVHYSLGY